MYYGLTHERRHHFRSIIRFLLFNLVSHLSHDSIKRQTDDESPTASNSFLSPSICTHRLSIFAQR
ncbi:hypothetical protein OUZ56_013037 [Daphnia magna]|uniref:Uncharacterized protein n=1 Tax=Daphnia magna TaxID=35525 RepID=A0ABQ9Z4R3_9CRUS|nr:hypothetical protein OUZ56_013037 [Daphnia magna]